MNPQSDSSFPNSSESPDPSALASQFAEQAQPQEPELDLWEPPFERWLRLADDLLRDWPHGPLPEHRV
jgi:hypothetical protein